MRGDSISKLILTWWIAITVVTGHFASDASAATDTLPPGEALGSMTSDDGNATVVVYGSPHQLGGVRHLAFYDSKGNLRTLVVGRHAGIRYVMSADGYVAVAGQLAGGEGAGTYLTLYSPLGGRQWERQLSPGRVLVIDLDVAPTGARTALLVQDRDWGGPCRQLRIFGGHGLAVATRELPWAGWLQFCGGGSFLAVTTRDDISLFSPVSGKRLWRVPVETGVMYGRLCAMSPDASMMVLLDRVRVKPADKTELVWRATRLDVKKGSIIGRQTLPGTWTPSTERPIRYDPARRAFVVASKQGDFTLTWGQ